MSLWMMWALMHLPERDGDLDGGVQELVERQRPVPEEAGDGHAAEVLEHHQQRLLVAAKLVAADDAWEVEVRMTSNSWR